MKTLTLSLALVVSVMAKAQDVTTINELAASATLEQIKMASDKIASSASEKFEYYKTTDRSLRDEKFKVVIYTPEYFTDYDKMEFTADEKAKCLLVVWRVNSSGFSFNEVTSQESNIKPFWNATFSQTETDYRLNEAVKYKYVTNDKTVSIIKSY